ELSPPLYYVHNAPYCGDQRVQKHLGEECDDGNLLDGDGCTRNCHKEAGFNCIAGEPSLCYVYDGDGVCEEFERKNSVRDCGFSTPVGFTDQWASHAFASHHDDRKCPVSMVTGEPAVTKVCKTNFVDFDDGLSHYAWFPCTSVSAQELVKHPFYAGNQEAKIWLKVCFDQPAVATSVFLFLAADGMAFGDLYKKSVTAILIDLDGTNHTLGTYELSCQRNPLIINVTHNLSLPFYKTTTVFLNFSSSLVALSGVALRTYTRFHTMDVTHCSEREVYSQQKQSCVRQTCRDSKCTPLQIEHAKVNCTAQDDRHAKCAVTCLTGFTLKTVSGKTNEPFQKEVLLSCAFGRWDRTVTCDLVDCGALDQSHVYYATFSCPEGTTFGKSCSFTCISPAKMQGTGVNHWLTCLEDGLWSFPEAYCKLECHAPPPIPNAKLLASKCQHGGHDVGAVCRYKCQPGYYMAGSINKQPRKRFLKIQCLEGGVWEEGGCTPVLCDPPPPVFEGMYDCTNGFEFDSVCTLKCKEHSEWAPIQCSKEGTWTEEFQLCESMKGECLPPSELNLVEYSCEQGYKIGAVCTPSCIIPPSDPVVLPANVTADTMEYWMEPTQVESIICTGMMRWHPDPQLIHCIQSCEPF
uniref:Sushi domain-containing protein n=1 Tax=Latimeria chalumnae TaxID=7897 RepID=H2ZXT1_LATCH